MSKNETPALLMISAVFMRDEKSGRAASRAAQNAGNIWSLEEAGEGYTHLVLKDGAYACIRQPIEVIEKKLNDAAKSGAVTADFSGDCVPVAEYEKLLRQWDTAATRAHMAAREAAAVRRGEEKRRNEKALKALLAYKKETAREKKAEERLRRKEETLKRLFKAGRMLRDIFARAGIKTSPAPKQIAQQPAEALPVAEVKTPVPEQPGI
jgi:hypothetical protein